MSGAKSENRSRACLPVTSNLNRFDKFFHCVKKEKISNAHHNIFYHTLNMLLHYFVKLLIRLNIQEIWKKMKTKCIHCARTEYNLSIASLLIADLLITSLSHSR